MSNLTKIVDFYKDLGVDEILSEDTVNRFQLKDDGEVEVEDVAEPEININNVPTSDNIITNNFANMTQSQAIARLAKKQGNNDNSEINSIADIVKQSEDIVSKVESLEDLEQSVKDFEGCALKKMATNTVFCDGNPESDIMIIGEAPGNHEDLQGIPFCGDSGYLLDQMFKAINKTRKDLYITNTLFWRPPGNRRPTEDELAICRPFVEKHIELISPKLIVLMGATAMTSVLGIKDPISKVRGKLMDYNNDYLENTIKAITLFHPSYLMRQPTKKKLAWQDLITIENYNNE